MLLLSSAGVSHTFLSSAMAGSGVALAAVDARGEIALVDGAIELLLALAELDPDDKVVFARRQRGWLVGVLLQQRLSRAAESAAR
jgi:hypothetical protein